MAIVLAGDIGGTKTHLGLFRAEGSTIAPLLDRIYVTRDYPNLETAVAHFLDGRRDVAVACFGVPGPVINGVSHATNVPWDMSEPTIAKSLGGPPTQLINDLEATAYGVIHLPDSEIAELQRGERHERANIAVIAAGTGLGEAGLVAVRSGGWQAIASEGGHGDFAPRGADQTKMLEWLAREFGHVSFERVLSGPGLHNIYRYLVAARPEPEPQWLVERMLREDASAVISETALEGRDSRCVSALETFVAIYGAEAANLALKFLAVGGLYIGGGIAPKILPFIRLGGFMRAFLDKGRLRSTLERIPVRVSLNPDAALLGAAHMAASML
ncbi:MAG TPA: glucokinase [Candidatus Binataceae bacterium]|nr:glucokinase [Candidatus Binataceae bacterium]